MVEPKKKPRKPLTDLSPAKLREWVEKSLEKVSNSATPAVVFGATKADHPLKKMIKQLREDFPERVFTTPSGEEWKGTELPKVVLTSVFKADKGVRGNMLNMAVDVMGNDEVHMRWLLASGFNPTKFSQENKNTPVGGLAMRGKYIGLRACREAGFDLSAMINKEHLHSIPEIRRGALLGTSLLHRTAAHGIHMKSKAIRLTLEELLLAGLDPLLKSAQGKTPLDMATGHAEKVLQEWIAREQAKALDATTDAALAPARTPRL